MTEKRALIVDDSKSARVVLSRMLQKYDLAVDTSDSAEQALEYLKAHRPDVIFMDHLMPGMDGLEAVQAIRNNPETAEIPIMMYTSQEGELYLGQARASGATGVLPKKIGSTEVSKILQDLRLVGGADAASIVVLPPGGAGEAMSGTMATLDGAAGGDAPAGVVASSGLPAADATPLVTAAMATSAAPAAATAVSGTLTADDLRTLIDPLLKQHSADLRRFVVASLDSFAARVSAETRDLIRAMPAPVVAAPVVVAPPPAPEPMPPPPAPRPVAWIAIAAVALVAALAAAGYAWQQHGRLAELEAKVAAAPAAATPAVAAPVAAPTVAPPLASAPFAYAEPPLSGARLERLAAVLDDLEHQRVHGTVLVTIHTAEFCLTGNPAEGYVLAPDDMPADRCDQVGNPSYDALRTAQRETPAYAELVAATRARTNGALDARVVEAARKIVATPYPGEGATAAQWNAAANANQRVDFVLEAPAAP